MVVKSSTRIFLSFLFSELLSPANYSTVFDKFTAETWQESLEEAEYADKRVNSDTSFMPDTLDISYGLKRAHIKRYVICQAKNMSQLLDGRQLKWYVKGWL